MNLNYPPGATPLDIEELKQLIPPHIATQKELNEWEENNIKDATLWLDSYKGEILTMNFLKKLHQKMFGMLGWHVTNFWSHSN